MGGAEKLLGRGDMLFMPTEAAKPKRLQGCYVSDAETERLVYFWGSQRREEVASLKIEEFALPLTGARRGGFPDDPLLEAARQLAKEHKHISTSFLQRKLRIGYPRAARIMEQLEEEGFKREEGEV
jgi:S-DNA-T family DNA segregation ATPase FtsK/SpoIIIE